MLSGGGELEWLVQLPVLPVVGELEEFGHQPVLPVIEGKTLDVRLTGELVLEVG